MNVKTATYGKRILCMFAALIMLCAMAVPAFASEVSGSVLDEPRDFYSWEELSEDPRVTVDPESEIALCAETYSTSLTLTWQGGLIGQTRSYSGSTLYCTFANWDESYNEGVFGRLTSQVGTRGVLGFSSLGTTRRELANAPRTFTETFAGVGSGNRAFAFSIYRGDFMCDNVTLGSR